MNSTTRKPRLLFISGRGKLDASAHKRIFDLLPLFWGLGYEARAISHEWELLWTLRQRADNGSRSVRRLLYCLNALRLTPALIRNRENRAQARFARLAAWADVVIINQSFLDEQSRQVLRQGLASVAYDFDDAVWLRGETGFQAMLGLADVVIAGNEYLAAKARETHARVHVIPTTVRADRYAPFLSRSRKANEPFTIGWIGSPSTVRYLRLLEEPLAALGAEIPSRLVIVGSGVEPAPSFRNVSLVVHPRIPYDPVLFVPNFDVGVMPLEDTEWEKGKCGAKALEYMAAARPAVCSPVGVNPFIIKDGVTGFLASTASQWISQLRCLALDGDLRHSVGQAGRQLVERTYSSEAAAKEWHPILSRLLSEARTPLSHRAEIAPDRLIEPRRQEEPSSFGGNRS